jgi:hypothetical protein
MKTGQLSGYAHVSREALHPSANHHQLPGLFPRVALLLCLLLVLVIAGVRTSGRPCDTPFGSLIGVALDVPAYSNCNSDYTSNESYFVNITGAPGDIVYSGMPWQCVEYARRFLILNPPHVAFAGVDGACDIWSLTTVQGVLQTNMNREYPFATFPNGNATSRPRVGDLIIYPRQPNGFPFGHVAVIVGTTLKTIEVGEQNWDSYAWTNAAQNYSRSIPLARVATTGAWLIDDPDGIVAGWKRVIASQ